MTILNLQVIQGDTLNIPVQVVNPNVPKYDFTGLEIRLQAFTGPNDPILWEASNGARTSTVPSGSFASFTPTFSLGLVQATVQATAAQTAQWPIGTFEIDLSISRSDMGHYTVAQHKVTVLPPF